MFKQSENPRVKSFKDVTKALTVSTAEAAGHAAFAAGVGGLAGSLGTEVLTDVGQPDHNSHDAIHSGAAGAGLVMFFAALMYKLLRHFLANHTPGYAHRTPIEIVATTVARPDVASAKDKALTLGNLIAYFLAVGVFAVAGRGLVHSDEEFSVAQHEKLGQEVGTGIAVMGSFLVLAYVFGCLMSGLKQTCLGAPLRESEAQGKDMQRASEAHTETSRLLV